jgi:probable rRNA maturation factor
VKTGKSYYLLNRQRKHRIDARGVRRFLAGLVSEIGRPEASFTVVFVTDKTIHDYNLRYRHIDKPTDVLSFTGDDGYLGDIVISTETAWAQARKSSTLSFDDNIRRLTLHGFLHLAGFDHETDHGEMRAIEKRLRRKFQC